LFSINGDKNQEAKSNKVNQDIRQAAQLITTNQTGVSIENVESIITQIALRIAQTQGKAVTGQFIYQIANQIAQNPNRILAQVILKLAKQDDGGKTSQIINVINNVVAGSGSSTSITTIVKKFANIIGVSIDDGGNAKKLDTFNCVAEGINICSAVDPKPPANSSNKAVLLKCSYYWIRYNEVSGDWNLMALSTFIAFRDGLAIYILFLLSIAICRGCILPAYTCVILS
jgi:hypothetical protein